MNAHTVNELRQIVAVMVDSPVGPDSHAASVPLQAAEMLGLLRLDQTATRLLQAAEMLRYRDLR